MILYQLDGKVPNIALMRIASHHRALGDEVELRRTANTQRQLWDGPDDLVYGSLIFERTRGRAEELLRHWPGAKVGGTGWDLVQTLEGIGITTAEQYYGMYPNYRQSIGFSQRGCRLKCEFCVVPQKEGRVQATQTINEIWRGDPWPREILLLDNDFFGQPQWRDRIAEIQDGGFKISFNQGINIRFLNNETAAAVASVDYRDDSMKAKRVYTAWDSTKDERRVFKGLDLLVKHGVKPRHIMVYMLIGYWPGETTDDWVHRQSKLREFGCMPYPMPYFRTKEAVGFQRWCIGAYDKRITWDDWVRARYQPRNLPARGSNMFTGQQGQT